MSRKFIVNDTAVYSEINKDPLFADWQIDVGEAVFYADNTNLELAVAEALRYGSEQFGWSGSAQVHKLKSVDELVDILETFCEDNGLPFHCAEELLEHSLSPEQHKWLKLYIEAWDRT